MTGIPRSLFNLDGKSALVTGAGRGIGLAAAEILARAQEMAAGPALDAADERAARASGWR